MKKISILLLGCFVMSLFSCSKFVDDINTDPNNPTDAPISNVLNSCLVGIITPFSGEDARLGAMWAGQFTGVDRQYASYNVYLVTPSAFAWDKYYINSKNADIVIEKANVSGNKLASGIAKVIKGMNFGTTAALFGDMPFSESLLFPEVTDPVFEGQLSVYEGVQTILDEAIADLSQASATAVGSEVDLYFNGDPQKWIAVANTLKARYYLHTGNYSAALTAASNGIVRSEDDLLLPFNGGVALNDMNTYYAFGKVHREGYMTAAGAFLPSILDPNSGAYRGNAKTDETARYEALYVNDGTDYDLNYNGYWTATSQFPCVSAVENHLIIAECQARQNADQEAIDALNAARGINLSAFGGSFDDYEMADFDTGGMANNGGSVNASILHEIIEEKYISLVGQIEVFNDLRRTKNMIGITPTDGSKLPERFLIPQDEINTNENVPSALPGLYDATAANQ